MKKTMLFLLMILSIFAVGNVFAEKLISMRTLSLNIDEFVFQRNGTANTPEGGAAIFINALIAYTKDKNVGMQCLTVALDQSRLTAGSTYKGFTPDKRAAEKIVLLNEKAKSYIPYSYIVGTHPDRDYAAILPFVYSFVDDPKALRSENEAKIFISTSGDLLPRAIYLKRNDKGIWKVTEFDEIMKDVTQPVHKKGDDL